MSEAAKDTISPEMLYSDRLTWADFQSALDAYRDAAYWAGYRDAKDEILELHAKGEISKP